MAEYVSKTKGTEVNKDAVSSVVLAMEQGKETRIDILKKHNIYLDKAEWFNMQDWLNAFKEMSEFLGDMNIFIIGKSIVNTAIWPPLNSLKEALEALDIAYHMNTRINGKLTYDERTRKMLGGIGNYKLVEFDEKGKRAIMVCDTPFPSKFDEGIITQLVRRFKPLGSRESVDVDLTKENKLTGGDSCTYIIKW